MTNETIISFRNLDAWKVSMDLVLTVYSAADHLPASERYELSSQLRRAVVSIPSNVAEGQGYGKEGSTGRYLHHVRIALGSHAEVVTLVEIMKRLHLVAATEFPALEEQLNRTGQLLHGLRRCLWRERQRGIVTSLALLGPAFWLLFSILR
jgi:four helix bundle protein